MNFLMSISPDNYNDNILKLFGPLETLTFGAQILLLGMGAVFAVLGIIFLLLTLFRFVFGIAEKKKSEQPVQSEIIAQTSDENSDEEIVAVIAAAIAMAESEANNVKFRVVSFKRK